MAGILLLLHVRSCSLMMTHESWLIYHVVVVVEMTNASIVLCMYNLIVCK